jgi:hypothetical protein
MGVQRHIIKRQVLEVGLPSADHAWQLQNRFSELYRQELLPVLEQLFDELCPAGETISIDKLEIELGAFTTEQFETGVREKLRAYLRDTFTPAIARAQKEGTATIANTVIQKEENEGDTLAETRVTVRSSFASSLALLAHFLQTGTLPWWYDEETYGKPVAILERCIAEADPFFTGRLGQLGASAPVRRRLLYTLTAPQLKKLLELFTGQPAIKYMPAYLEVADCAERLPLNGRPAPEVRHRILEAALQHIITGDNTLTLSLFEAWNFHSGQEAMAEELLSAAGVTAPSCKLVTQLLQEMKAGAETQTLPAPVLPREQTAVIDKEDLADFYISNAGLVLLWPFLPSFFGALGLVKNGGFADEAASHHAVHLLQYLSTGDQARQEEHDLVLNKILCGLDLTAPVEMNFLITEAEITECASLLQHVVAQWKAIGQTSVEGFRQTFLQKEGALKKAEKGWNLFVERKTVDMLLDRLPWGFSVIRFPWSKDVIYTEW